MSILSNKVIILNAPPSGGKDSVANALCEATGATHNRFKTHLYQCTATLFNVPVEGFKELAGDIIKKEEPHKSLTVSGENFTKINKITQKYRPFTTDRSWNVHISPREALIFTSEIVIKPIMGEEYFGTMEANGIDLERGAVFSDSGFDCELIPIINKVGAENVFVIQWTRDGCSFEGDSRDYLTVPDNVGMLMTVNEGTIDDLKNEILKWLEDK
jgi:hypothetical protein